MVWSASEGMVALEDGGSAAKRSLFPCRSIVGRAFNLLAAGAGAAGTVVPSPAGPSLATATSQQQQRRRRHMPAVFDGDQCTVGTRPTKKALLLFEGGHLPAETDTERVAPRRQLLGNIVRRRYFTWSSPSSGFLQFPLTCVSKF